MDKALTLPLKDIHLPEAVGFWPMAWGWPLLLVLVILLISTLAFVLLRGYVRGQPRRMALKLLTSYEQQYPARINTQTCTARISEVLKRVALVYFPREQVASLSNEDWINFLNNSSRGLNFHDVREALQELPYQPSKPHDLKPLFTMAKAWISQRRGPCLN